MNNLIDFIVQIIGGLQLRCQVQQQEGAYGCIFQVVNLQRERRLQGKHAFPNISFTTSILTTCANRE